MIDKSNSNKLNFLQVDLSDGEDGGEENAMGKKGRNNGE